MTNPLAESLTAQHRALEVLITEELKHPDPDQTKLSIWKKEKLRLKERLEALSSV